MPEYEVTLTYRFKVRAVDPDYALEAAESEVLEHVPASVEAEEIGNPCLACYREPSGHCPRCDAE
jgi:hypothetical protein